MGMRSWLRQRVGVRMRSALAAAAVVAVASVFTGTVFVVAARLILTDNVDQNTSQRAAQVAATLDDPAASLTAALHPTPRDRTVVQVLDADGRVIAASAALGGAGPLSRLRPAPGQAATEQRRLQVAHDNIPVRVAALGVSTPDGPRTVLVAQSIDVIDDGTEAAVGALAVALPLLTLVVGGATFHFVGRTLRPVEAMRGQADTITTRNLHARLPVPATTDEIAALAVTMNTMLDRIEAATTAQRRFVADASHELRSPLSTIHAGLDLLAAAELPPNAAVQVGRMHQESDRMSRLIADLLLLARFDESAPDLRHEDVDLDDLVYTERDRLTAAHPDLRVSAQAAPTRVRGDPHHLQRALRNLLDNAARHTQYAINIRLETVRDVAVLTVTDDGPGVAPADRERIFDRFVRLDGDRSRAGGGTGLGLPIAREIVTAHGGTLTVHPADTGGARLRIELPL